MCCHSARTEPFALTFAAMELPIYMEADGTGPLYEIHQQVVAYLEAQLPISIRTQIVPPMRANQMYKSGQAVAFVPDFCDVGAPIPTVHSIPFARVQRFIFTRANQVTLTSVEQLADKKVALVRGYMYQLPKPLPFHAELTINQRNALRMLNSGRVDAIIANPVELAKIAQRDSLAMPDYNPVHPISDKALCYSFRDNNLGRQLAIITSQALLQLRHEGILAKTLNASHLAEPAVLK